jgi:hypothetical protein
LTPLEVLAVPNRAGNRLLVAAIGGGGTSFLANDRRLPPGPGLRVTQLASHVHVT